MTTAAPNPSPYEFCQYVHTDGRRCVSGYGHGGDHFVQPVSSVAVQAIERREKVLDRLGGDRPAAVNAERLTTAVGNAVGGVQEENEDVARNRTNEAALGAVTERPNAEQLAEAKHDQAPVEQEVAEVIDARQLSPAQLRQLADEAERGYDTQSIASTRDASSEQGSTMTETPQDDNVVTAVEAPQNDPTSPISAAQPSGDEVIATQVDDEPAQIAEVPSGNTSDA